MYPSLKRSFIGHGHIVLGLIMAILVLSACATAPVAPEASLQAARDAIASAEQDGARQHAGAELDEAQEQLVKAERLVSREQMNDADRFARQAQVAAQLASARTEAAKAAAINRELRRSAEALVEEMQRAGDQQ